MLAKKTVTIGLILLLLLSVMLSMSLIVSADVTYDDTTVINVDNENYTFPSSGITFSEVAFNESDSWIRFNDIDFNVTSENSINLTVSYLNSNILSASAGDTVLSFSANSTGGSVYFNLSGFSPSTVYTLYRDDATVSTYTTDGEGNLNFTNDVWSDHDFDVKEGDQTGSRTVQVNYEHDLLGVTYTKGVNTIGLFSLIMVFAALGVGLMFLTMIKGGRN